MEEKSLLTTPDTDLSDLVLAAQRGDADAFAQLVKGCERTLYRVSYTVLQGDRGCADAVQEAICRAWLQLGALKEPNHFRTWLARILLDECCRQMKRGKRATGETEPNRIPEDGGDGDEVVDLRNALAALPARQRSILWLYHIEGMTVDELAHVLHVPPDTGNDKLAEASAALAVGLRSVRDFWLRDELYAELREAFPPTPAAFKNFIEQTLNALPERRARWRLPAPVAATYAVAACVVFALLFSGLLLSSGGGSTASPSAPPSFPSSPLLVAPSTEASPPQPSPSPAVINNSGFPTPPPASPLTVLVITSDAEAPAAGGGWQAAAVSGKVTWYFNPSKSELSRIEEGKTVSIKLAMAQGQAVDAYTFLPAKDGRWLAFTVHGTGGDTAWLVTSDGRKLVIPDDIQWLDYTTYKQLKFNFADSSILIYDHFIMGTADASAEASDAYAPYDDIYLGIRATNGVVYQGVILLDSYQGYRDFTINDRRGFLYEGYTLNKKDFNDTNKSGWSIVQITSSADGSYRLNFRNGTKSDLQSNRFSMFKTQSFMLNYILHPYALFVYQDDPAHALWKLNFDTGRSQKVADHCLSAGWMDSNNFWYVSDRDKMIVKTNGKETAKSIVVSAGISTGVYQYGSTDSMVTLLPSLTIQNYTNGDITVPDKIPCSLRLKKNGKVIWEQQNDVDLTTVKFKDLTDMSSFRGQDLSAPASIPPGFQLQIQIAEVRYVEAGAYTLEGEFYNGSTIYCQITFPQYNKISSSISMKAALDSDKKLLLTIMNHSVNAYAIPVAYTQYKDWLTPPILCYRLSIGNKELSKGTMKLILADANKKEYLVPAGEGLSLVEQGKEPAFANLKPGVYKLECFLSNGSEDIYVPWGFAGSNYFDVTFTVPKKS